MVAVRIDPPTPYHAIFPDGVEAAQQAQEEEGAMKRKFIMPVIALSISAFTASACGTVGGAAVGAGAGAAVGAGTGYGAGKGALIGTGVGAAAGAVYDITKKK